MYTIKRQRMKSIQEIEAAFIERRITIAITQLKELQVLIFLQQNKEVLTERDR